MPSQNSTNPFYSSDQTTRSRRVLNETLDAHPDAILIGGWATWYRTRGPMSHDIDLIVNYPTLETIQSTTDDFSESHHIGGTKWRATIDGIHLDLYVPHRSTLGANLQLAVHKLIHYDEIVEGRRLLAVPAHTATKFAALLDRPHSLPGRKDRHEIRQLLDLEGAERTAQVIATASQRTPRQQHQLIHAAFDLLVADPTINRRERTRLRTIPRQWVGPPGPQMSPGTPTKSQTPPGPTR